MVLCVSGAASGVRVQAVVQGATSYPEPPHGRLEHLRHQTGGNRPSTQGTLVRQLTFILPWLLFYYKAGLNIYFIICDFIT